ncbi:MAG: methionine adenosyltransferase domain-containing protein [Candidatus Paceibacterota bacterium]
MIRTSEFVSPHHPDKLCDRIADKLLDAYLCGDSRSRVALEVLGGHGVLHVTGEVTSNAKIVIEDIVHSLLPDIKVQTNITEQSSEIAQGVDSGGAGDQGIMVGYATRETPSFMPREYELARSLCKTLFSHYPFDGKVQVTTSGKRVLAVVASFQHSKTAELLNLVQQEIQADEYYINPAGEWNLGGFDADTGLSGRKIVIDSYGPRVSVGGGSFSGKDLTKVDRSGAYMARKIAVDYLKKENAEEVRVELAYAIGKKNPLRATALVDGVERVVTEYDLSPRGIHSFLDLGAGSFFETAEWGHFGNNFPWDN